MSTRLKHTIHVVTERGSVVVFLTVDQLKAISKVNLKGVESLVIEQASIAGAVVITQWFYGGKSVARTISAEGRWVS